MTAHPSVPVLYVPPVVDPYATPYAAPVAKVEIIGIQKAREAFRARIDAAKAGVHTVVAMRGEPEAVIVDMKWYREMRALSGDPTDL